MAVMAIGTREGMPTLSQINVDIPDSSSESLQRSIRELSQIVYRPPYETQGMDEGIIKERIFRLARNHPLGVATALEGNQFQFQDKLKDVISKIQYLNKNRFLRLGQCCGLPLPMLTNTKYSHHLSKNLGNLSTMSKGAAYFIAGMSMAMLGFGQLQNPTTVPNVPVGGGAVCVQGPS